MPAPASASYSAAVLVAIHGDLLDLIDGGSSAALVKLYSEADVLLAEITLDDPAGTVNGTTGQLTLTQDVAGTGLADAVCTYGTITDGDDTVIATLPASEGSSAVSGEIVLNSEDIVTGAAVNLTSATIG